MFTTYNSLTQNVMNTLDRTDTSTLNQIPYFIYQAEVKMCELIKTLGVEDYVVGTFKPGVDVYPYPARMRRVININYGTGLNNNTRNQLQERSYEYCRMYTPDSNTPDNPKFYADYGVYNFLVVPTPAVAYPFEISYMGLPEPLTPLNQTNWFTNYASNALFYATMIEGLNYLKDYEQVPPWEEKFKEACAILQNTDDMRKRDRGVNRDAD
jgi:hypothetical protein